MHERPTQPTKLTKPSLATDAPSGFQQIPQSHADIVRLQQVIGNRNTQRHLSQPVARQSTVAVNDSAQHRVIQRAVGIEYETGIQARNSATYDPNVQNTGWIDQDAVIANGNNWEIQSDNSKLEFVTGRLDMQTLATTMNDMLDAIGTAQDLLRNTPLGTQLTLQQLFPNLTINPPNANYIIINRTGNISGAPQGTIGIPYARLYKFFDFLTKYELQSTKEAMRIHKRRANRTKERLDTEEDPQKEAKKQLLDQAVDQEEQAGSRAISNTTAAKYDQIKGVVDVALPETRHAETQKLKGLLHFIAQYALEAQNPANGYKKKKFAVMARSSFYSMYQGLDSKKQRIFRAKANAVLINLGLPGTTVMFPNSKASFTLTQWLDSIQNGEDIYIPTDNRNQTRRTATSDKMTAPGVWVDNTNTDKSMGSMGLDNDQDGDQLVVVELRNLFHFRSSFGSFPVAAMRQMAADLAAILQG